MFFVKMDKLDKGFDECYLYSLKIDQKFVEKGVEIEEKSVKWQSRNQFLGWYHSCEKIFGGCIVPHSKGGPKPKA